MSKRFISIGMAKIMGGLALFYVLQNFMNVGAAYEAMAYVMSGGETPVYPNNFGPLITSPALVWVAIALVFTLELTAGVMALWGAFSMWQARNDSAEAFNEAKCKAIWGAAIGVFVWFGLFGVVAGGYFQMWQHQIGVNSLVGAFQYGVTSFLILMYLRTDDA